MVIELRCGHYVHDSVPVRIAVETKAFLGAVGKRPPTANPLQMRPRGRGFGVGACAQTPAN